MTRFVSSRGFRHAYFSLFIPSLIIFCIDQVQLEEGGVRLSLTVVDTPGYGDRLDNTDCWAPALTYLHTQV